MPANQIRGTPGLFLLIFACVLLLSAAGGWKLHLQARSVVTAVPLTGLGDTRYYTALSQDDYNTPALIFSQAPQGLFRLAASPVHRDDAKMFRVETEASGHHSVYVEARRKPESASAMATRWYLKAGTDSYLEFGARTDVPDAPSPKN